MKETKQKTYYDTFRNVEGKNVPIRVLNIPQYRKTQRGLCPVCGYVNFKKNEGCNPCFYCKQLIYFPHEKQRRR